MKKRRLKKKKGKEDTSQVVKVFNEVDIPSSPVPTKSSIYCLFCYKLTSIENSGESPSQTEKLTTCHRFYKNVANEKFTFLEEVYGTKCGVCDDCYYVVDNHCKLHFEVECLQLRLRWQLYKLFRVMKYAGRVPSRVKLFKESLMTEKMTNGDSVSLEGVLGFRQKLYDKCSRRLKNKKPRVLLSNGLESGGVSNNSITKPKLRRSKEAKNKISQGTQTLVEFSDIACNTSETGNVEVDQQPGTLKQGNGSQSQLETEIIVKNTNKSIEGCENHNSEVCSVCGMGFKRKRNLNLHMKNHQENENTETPGSKLEISKCKRCLGGFYDQTKLDSHKNGQLCTKVDGNTTTVTVSEEVDQRNWRFKGECPECRVIFKERSEEQLNTLIKFHLEVSEVHARIVDSWIHICQFCGIRFQYQCHYKTHLALHEEHSEVNEKDEASAPKILDGKGLAYRRRVGRPSLKRLEDQGTTSNNTTNPSRVGRPSLKRRVGRPSLKRRVGRPSLKLRVGRFNDQPTITKDENGRLHVSRPSQNCLTDQATIAPTLGKDGRRLFSATCKKCGKTYQSGISEERVQIMLRGHLQSKFHVGDRNRKFCCLICDRKYPGETHLLIHLRSNIHNSKAKKTNFKILKCDKCPGAFLSQVKLRNHKKNKQSFCRKFGKSGKDSSEKLDFNYVCNLCSMYFQERGQLRKHANLHKAGPDSKKEIANDDEMDTYDDMTGADADIEIEINNAEESNYEILGEGHNEPQSTNPLYKCIICYEICPSEEILVEHARTKHWPLETSDTRNDADPNTTNTNCEVEREDGVVNIKTNRCKKAESHPLCQSDSYKDPMFVCIVCKKPYSSLSSLNSHMMVAHDIIIRPVNPPPVDNIPTQQAPSNDDDDDIEIIENEIEEVAEEQEIQISVLGCETTSSKDDVDPLEAHEEPQPQSSEGHGHGKKLMEMKCQVCSKTFMGWSKSYLLATLKEHSEQHTNPSPSPVTTAKPVEEFQDNSSVPIPLISIDDMADEDEKMDVEDASSSEDHIQVRKSSQNQSYAYEAECPKCGKLFYGRNGTHTKQYVQRHLRSKLHGGTGNNYKSCDNCGKRFRTRNLLEEHKLTACETSDGVEIVNDDGEDDDFVSGPGNRLVLREIFKCCHCSKTFSTQEKLASHEGARQCFNDNDESDHGEDDVDEGDAVEIEESNPQEIELSSDSEYSPDYENSVTKRKQPTQVETEIFKCPVQNCNTFFSSNEELGDHLAIHVDFACAFCDFCTKHPYDLVDHENTLHTYCEAGKNLKCSRCPEIFDLSQNSNSHRIHFLHDHLGIEAE